MQPHKIVARAILPILSVINIALAAPVFERGIREVYADAVNVAEDVTTASQKRWNPSDKLWTTAAGSSDSDYRLEQELRPRDPRSLMGGRDSNSPIPQPSLGSESTDPVNTHLLPVDPPSPVHNNLPLDIDLNAAPQPSQELTDGSDSDTHSTGSMSPWSSYEAWVISKSPSSSPSHDSNPPPRGNSDVLHNPLDQSVPKTLSDPGPLWQYSPEASDATVSDPGSSRPSHSEQSTADSKQSTRPDPASDPVLLTADSKQSTRPDLASDPVPSTSHPPSRGPVVFFSELLRGGRIKRRISGSRSVNAAQRELPDILDSREYVSASAFSLPLTYQLPWS